MLMETVTSGRRVKVTVEARVDPPSGRGEDRTDETR